MGQVLIFDTAIATSNQGDEIIMQDVLEFIKPILDEMQVYRLGTHLDNFSKEQMEGHNWKANVLADKASYKFICGTNLLTEDLDRMFPVWMLKQYNKRLYKDVILIGAGKHTAYELPNEYTQSIYKEVLNKNFKHSVRDNATKNVLEKMGLKAINTGCPTLWKLNREHCEKIPTKKSDKVIMSVSGHRRHINRDKDQEMINIINGNYSERYAWIQTTEDENYFDSLIGVSNYKKIYSINKYRKILQENDIDYVGTRLHGGIVALQEGKRTIIISIDQRAEGFHESNNIPIVRRDEIEKLENRINSVINTDIIVDFDAINEFLGQFPEIKRRL